VRESEETRRLPAVVLTSSRERADLSRAYELGVDAYLVKPVGFDELRALAATLRDAWRALSRGEPFAWTEARPRPEPPPRP
jgi:CheY-like chemotaxis protein